MTRSRDIGTATEELVVRYLIRNGFPYAERTALHGRHDRGDITGTPGIAWEVKGGKAAESASDGLIADWMAETLTEQANAKADVGILVCKRKGFGPANVGSWWAMLPLSFLDGVSDGTVRLHLRDAVKYLRALGYGSPAATHSGPAGGHARRGLGGGSLCEPTRTNGENEPCAAG